MKRKKRAISKNNISSLLYVDNEKEIRDRSRAREGSHSEIVRNLVSEALRARHLKEYGKDETMWNVREAQRRVVGEGIVPLVDLLEEQKRYVEALASGIREEYLVIQERLKTIETNSSFLVRAADRILQNMVFVRALIWHYIFTFYHAVIVSANQKLTRAQLERNLDDRMKEIKIEAAKENTHDSGMKVTLRYEILSQLKCGIITFTGTKG
ncbi:MAG: hypothetical protein AUG51_24030 [Acidobacteria bacterium 13_1_20CM_3_53_8]|nr:MAG: hypothetical protein AUG51_24030 [Acidobacteria bacterium 13_1_20CM_3_53_8]